jgi:hypothetical protein
MKRFLLPFFLITFLFTACTPVQTAIPQPKPTPATGVQTTVQPETMPAGQISPTVTEKPKGKKSPDTSISSTKTKGKNTPEPSASTEKTKGKNPETVPTYAIPEMIAAEISGRPTETSITLNVVPAVPMEISYEYGTASGAYSSQTVSQTAAAGVPLETLIDGLKPNTRYYYRIRYGSTTGQEHTFVTQRAPGSSFTFDIQGDSHPERVGKEFDATLYTRTLQSAAADQPDFYMTIGDDFSVDQLKTVNAETVKELYIHQRQWLGLVGAPVFLVNGNHEQASLANLNNSPDNVAVWAQTARNTYFPEPAPDPFYSGDTETVNFIGQLRDYYAFTWGDALFIVIDPYWHSQTTVDNSFGGGHEDKKNRDLWNVTLGDTQYQWFKQTLETSTAKYKFVFTHHILGTGRGGIELADSYEWGDAVHLAENRPGWDKTIQQLMADNHVTIFFQGHDHIFVHQELDGVIYQTLPEPANPNYSLENADAYLSGDKLPNSGHVRVNVSPNGVKVDYIRSYLDQPDELAFSYTIP